VDREPTHGVHLRARVLRVLPVALSDTFDVLLGPSPNSLSRLRSETAPHRLDLRPFSCGRRWPSSRPPRRLGFGLKWTSRTGLFGRFSPFAVVLPLACVGDRANAASDSATLLGLFAGSL
jgi:hypothetical protein